MTDIKNRCYRIQMKLYRPDGMKVGHCEVELPVVLDYLETYAVFEATELFIKEKAEAFADIDNME